MRCGMRMSVAGLIAVLLGAMAPGAAQEQTANLVSRPGFEAADSSLKTCWRLPASEWAVDRTERHTGNQSMKLSSDAASRTRGVHQLLPADRIKAPCRLLVSAWSKAAGVSGEKDSDYAIYVDVSYTDGTHLYAVNVPFDTGTHDWQYASVAVDVAKPVKMFALHLLFRGSHTGTVWFDDVLAGVQKEGMARYEGRPLAYTIPERVVNARKRSAMLQEKIGVLERSIQSAEEKGMDISGPRVTLAVAKIFASLIPKDAELELEDYPPNMIDFRILGREEAVKRIQALSDFEGKETERILDRAIQEVDQALKGEIVLPKTSPSEVRQIAVKNGGFCSGDRPVFASGFHNTAFSLRKTEWLDTFKQLGANTVGPLHIRDACCKGWETFDESYFRDEILPLYHAAEEKGMLVVSGMWNYRAPAWLEELAPEISVTEKRGWLREAGDDVSRERGWFRDAFDIDHPLTERYQETWFRYAVSQLKTAPNNVTYSLMGEEWCNPTYRSPYTAARYEAWLKAKHRDIEGLNRAWGTQYKDFKEAAARQSQSTPGGRYDWYVFNEDRLTTYNQWQINGILSADPAGLPSCWPAAGGLVSAPLGGFDPAYGRNREEII
ncbi:MAG: beta-galactosidase, partial [Candidatus Eisenbacteria bacterium]|nr:beta-galactosidase [Candidatus Eisenbacteria bacterium]